MNMCHHPPIIDLPAPLFRAVYESLNLLDRKALSVNAENVMVKFISMIVKIERLLNLFTLFDLNYQNYTHLHIFLVFSVF